MSKNLKLKKVNKSFVPEPISSVFWIPMRYEHFERFMHVNILVVFLNIFGRGYATFSLGMETDLGVPHDKHSHDHISLWDQWETCTKDTVQDKIE